MKVEIAQKKLLSNCEVFWHLNTPREVKKENETNVLKAENYETIVFELKSYLSQNAAAKETPEKIKNFMKEISVFKLEKAELLQMINQAPTNLVGLYTLIEECDSRFTEEDTNTMLEIIHRNLL